MDPTHPRPLEAAARIYIGTDASQVLAARLFEYSVRRHATIPVVFDRMQDVHCPFPKDARNQPLTNFSFHRFAIPELAGYHGRAAYVDADMLVFGDIRELWEIPFEDATVLYAPSSHPKRPKQFSVMLLDCSRLRWDLAEIIRGMDEGRYDYRQLMGELVIEPSSDVQGRIPPEWNSLDVYVAGRVDLLHYTHIQTQPWVYSRHKHGDLWVECLSDAIAEGVISLGEVREAMERGWARPSLLRQLQTKRSRWPLFNRLIAPLLDRRFRPHRALRERQRQVSP